VKMHEYSLSLFMMGRILADVTDGNTVFLDAMSSREMGLI